MALSNEQKVIINTEWGLTIAGTRITLYDVLARIALLPLPGTPTMVK